MKLRVFTTAVLFAAAIPAMAAVSKVFRVEEQFTLAHGGTLVLNNPVGNIEIFGVDTPGVSVDVLKNVVASDDAGIEEGRNFTALVVGGDDRTRMLRADINSAHTRPWQSSVHWRVRVHRGTHLRIVSNNGQFIRVFNVDGSVFIRNINGDITLENVTGMVNADSVNGAVSFGTSQLRSDVRLASVNGSVTARVQADLDFRWNAETARGDIRTNLPVRGGFNATTFRGSVNAPGGPTLSTMSLMGNIYLFGAGLPVNLARSLREMPQQQIAQAPEQQNFKVGSFRRALVEGNMTYATNLGDVEVNQVRGDADIMTEAGTVHLGAVTGDAKVRSRGGALHLGEILGALQASTRAGNILVEAARRGGTLTTTGGTIRLLYTGGPTQLRSGGGDVVVRQAAGPVNAHTRSGDIAITVDPNARRQKIDAETEKGNIVLNVSGQFAADVEATILTTDPDAHSIHSDIPGLSVSREQVDGRTRVRAVGKINGGGDRVVLQAIDGSIRIVNAPAGPTLVGR